MKIIRYAIGVSILPLLLMIMFSSVNYVLSLLFNVPFKSIQHGEIWILEGIFIIVAVIIYFIDVVDRKY